MSVPVSIPGKADGMTRSGTWLSRLTYTRAPGAVLWIRFYVGAVFLCEGILKFLHTIDPKR